ncbi:MAG: hypothetical protein F6K23_26520 [Okeania sp. SIO2C9]|nr:hypothetical protein [Okeania sp. SIO2C9]NEQ76281.1 hypothetical protein [Okeania sp. SIO2C9]
MKIYLEKLSVGNLCFSQSRSKAKFRRWLTRKFDWSDLPPTVKIPQ